MKDKMTQLELELETLTIYRGLADTTVLKTYRMLLKATVNSDISSILPRYAEVFSGLLQAGFHDIGKYFNDLLKYSEIPHVYMLALENNDLIVFAAASRDIAILAELANLKCADIKQYLMEMTDGAYNGIIAHLPEWGTDAGLCAASIYESYHLYGSGLIAKYNAFIWNGTTLKPILSPDMIQYNQMIGYDWQREAVMENTRALCAGKTVNHVLLYGDCGTGKSATVKAMLNVPEYKNLALIEVPRHALTGLPELMDKLSGYPRRFILFIDDLSFEPGDSDYSALKVVLEGGLEQRPANIALYVTSNRRQLVKRLFSDRDEMNSAESVQEKTSLADRFGIRLPFFALNQDEYLTTVEGLVQQAGITMGEVLRQSALQWAIEHGARTPRIARQFVDEIAAKNNI